MKPRQSVLPIVLIVLLTLAALGVAIVKRPKLGLDIQGGARVVLEADTSQLPAGRTWDATTKSAVTTIITNRVNSNGVAEPVITPKGEKQFVVELPAVRNEQEILDQLQNTAQLQFYYSNDWVSQRNRLGRFSMDSIKGGAKNEEFQITDNTTKKTFRDRFHINLALREITDRGVKAGASAVTTTLPPGLTTLAAAQGLTNLPIAKEDIPKLADLDEELTSFDAFLKAANLVLTGSDLAPGTAHGGFSPGDTGKVEVALEFNEEGKGKFAKFTRDHTQEILMIYLDGRILIPSSIDGPILNGRAMISPFPTIRDAKTLADYLNGGALPVPLKIASQQSVQATLGSDAVRSSLVAGLVGLGLVAVFMIGYYLLPGGVSVLALTLYTLFSYAVFLLVNVTFTLPGIAGFILSIGMAVDANILIFERTKEELRGGKSLQRAVDSGFQRAFSAILDSNVCTAVTSLLLYNFGTGPVRGFALTLLIGVGISMFTAITVTRSLLRLIIGQKWGQSLPSWGINRAYVPRFNIVRNRKLWYGLSLAVIVPGLIFALMGGFKLGIDFTGGSEMTLRFNGPVAREAVAKAVTTQGIEDPTIQLAGDNLVYVRIPKQTVAGQSSKQEISRQRANEIVAGMQGQFPNVRQEEFNSIGSSISTELTRNALTSVLFSSLFIVFYLAFRFALGSFANGIKFGVAAIIAMLHDVLVLVGVFAFLGFLLGWKVDSLFVTAALTVIGFSVHDTIVIFDRIRENLRLRRGDGFPDMVDHSINETFTRSVNTSLTVIITLFALLIFGGAVIRPLNAALLIGIISGTYSSIFNAAPLVVDWERLFGKKKVATTKAAPIGPRGATRPVPATGPSGAGSPAGSSANGGAKSYSEAGKDGATSGGGQSDTSYANLTPKPGTPPGPPRPRKRRM